jgi:hypothetical protein
MPASFRGSIWAGDHDGIAIGVFHPTLPVVGAAVPIGRVLMPRKYDVNRHFGGALHDRIKVFYLEPEQDAISIGLVVGIADGPMMVFDLETVQLKNQLAVRSQLFVVRTAMTASATEQTLIPPAAGFDISDCDEGLRTHAASLVAALKFCNHPDPRRHEERLAGKLD